MNTQSEDRVQFNSSVQGLLRILIASYFLAVGLNIIPGTDFTALTGLIAPPRVASVLAAIIVFSLAYMVMIGYRTRAAAMLLGLMTFFASYVAMIELGVQRELGAFWRDLALIAALMLTYSEPAPRARRSQGFLRRKVMPRRIRPAGARIAPEPAAALAASNDATPPSAEITDFVAARAALKTDPDERANPRPTDLRAPLASDEIDNIFLDDMTIAQAT